MVPFNQYQVLFHQKVLASKKGLLASTCKESLNREDSQCAILYVFPTIAESLSDS